MDWRNGHASDSSTAFAIIAPAALDIAALDIAVWHQKRGLDIMPQAVVDPDEVRQFALNLKKFNTELRDRLASLHNQLRTLGVTWRDQEHKRFAEQFEGHTKNLVRFIDANDSHVRYLVRKAEQIEEYLQS